MGLPAIGYDAVAERQLQALIRFINQHSPDGKPLVLRREAGFLIVRECYTKDGEWFEEEHVLDPNLGAAREWLGY